MNDTPVKMCIVCYAFSPSATHMCPACSHPFYVKRSTREELNAAPGTTKDLKS